MTTVDDSRKKLIDVKNKVDEVKSAMHENITIALDNTLKIDDISLKTQELENDTRIFRGTAKDLRNRMWWKNVKMIAAIVAVCLTLLAIIITVAVLSSRNKSSRRLIDDLDFKYFSDYLKLLCGMIFNTDTILFSNSGKLRGTFRY